MKSKTQLRCIAFTLWLVASVSIAAESPGDKEKQNKPQSKKAEDALFNENGEFDYDAGLRDSDETPSPEDTQSILDTRERAPHEPARYAAQNAIIDTLLNLNPEDRQTIVQSYSQALDVLYAEENAAGTRDKLNRNFADIDENVMMECHALYGKGLEALKKVHDDMSRKIDKERPELLAADRKEDRLDAIDEEVLKLIKKNLVNYEGSPIGKAEVNAVKTNNGKLTLYFIRVVHFASNKSIAYGEDLSENRHFQRWLALQHFEAQRDRMMVVTDGNNKPNYMKVFHRPESAFTMQSLQEYHTAVWQNASWNSIDLAAMCTAFEMGAMACLDMTVLNKGGEELSWKPYAVKLFFGLTVGSFNRFYENVVKLEGRTDNGLKKKVISVLKRSSLSVAFGISMYLATTDYAQMSLSGHATSFGMAIMFAALTNMFVSNWVKDEYMQVSSDRSDLRVNKGDVGVPTFTFSWHPIALGKNGVLGVKNFWLPLPVWFHVHPNGREDVEKQTLRIGTGLLRYADIKETDSSPLLFAMKKALFFSTIALPLIGNYHYLNYLLKQAEHNYAAEPTEYNLAEVRKIQKKRDEAAVRLDTYNVFKWPYRAISYVLGIPSKGLKVWQMSRHRSLTSQNITEKMATWLDSKNHENYDDALQVTRFNIILDQLANSGSTNSIHTSAESIAQLFATGNKAGDRTLTLAIQEILADSQYRVAVYHNNPLQTMANIRSRLTSTLRSKGLLSEEATLSFVPVIDNLLNDLILAKEVSDSVEQEWQSKVWQNIHDNQERLDKRFLQALKQAIKDVKTKSANTTKLTNAAANPNPPATASNLKGFCGALYWLRPAG